MTPRITEKPSTKNFKTQAQNFCNTVETHPTINTIQFLQDIYNHLLNLLITAPEFPEIHRSELYEEKPKLKWKKLYKELKTKLKKYTPYLYSILNITLYQ